MRREFGLQPPAATRSLNLPPQLKSGGGFVHRECNSHLADRGGAICDARKSGSSKGIREHRVINCACFCT